MTYVTSKNLKNKYKTTKHLYVISENYNKLFCEKCRKVSAVTSKNKVCPRCGFKDSHPKYVSSYYTNGSTAFVYDIVDSVTINKNIDDEGAIHDINATILYRNYQIDDETDHMKSYQFYDRIIFNFDTKQIYYTSKSVLSHKVDFSHFKIYKEPVFEKCEFSPMLHTIIKQIYDTYGISKSNVPFYNTLSVSFKSNAFAFMCLKFPIVTLYMYHTWLGYKQTYKINDKENTVDMHIQMIYWSCNYDKTLKKVLTATSIDEYAALAKPMIENFTNDVDIIDEKIRNPIFIIYARFMYMLGFREFDSVEKVVSYMMNPDSGEKKMSVWLFDMIRKRHHTRNKMYRRFFKHMSEQRVVDMLVLSNRQSTYLDFYQCLGECYSINRFYTFLDDGLNDLNFSNNIDSIVSEVLL